MNGRIWGSVVGFLRIDLVKFALVGGATAIIQLSTYAVMIILSVNYELASLISMTLSTILAYVGNRLWTFHSENGWIVEFIGFSVSRIVTIMLNALLLYFLVQFVRVDEMTAQVLSILVITAVNYGVGKFLVFAPKRTKVPKMAIYAEGGARRDI